MLDLAPSFSETMTSSAPTIDVLQCSSEELAKFLLEHRFENDGMATTSFLLEGTTALPNAEAIAAQIMGVAAENNDGNDKKKKSPSKTEVNLVSSSRSEEESTNQQQQLHSHQLGESLHSKPVEISLANPRGKFNVTFHQDGIHAATVKNPQVLAIPAGVVRDMIVFPKPQDCQKVKSSTAGSPTSPMVLLCFEEEGDDDEGETVTFKDKPLSQICFSLPSTLEGIEEALAQMEQCDKNDTVNSWIALLRHSLQIPKTNIYRIANPANNANANGGAWTFKSHQEANKSTTSGGMPFVNCYYGVQDGCLFPMQQGLLFFKPPLFVPRSKLHSIACGRGNSASSRYVDMVVTTSSDETIEFSNISREELSVLNDYIYKTLIPAMQKDQMESNLDTENDDDNSSEDDVAVAVAEDDDDDDDDDEHDAETAEVEVEGARRRSKRRAAREACQQNKQHFLQSDGADNDDDGEDEGSDEDDFTEEDAEKDEVAFTDDEEDEKRVLAEAKIKGVDAGGDDDDGDEDDDEEEDEDEEAVADQEEDITESDADATDDDEEEDETSPPKAKKHKTS